MIERHNTVVGISIEANDDKLNAATHSIKFQFTGQQLVNSDWLL